MMRQDYQDRLNKARSAKKQYKTLLRRLQKERPRDLDATVHALHEEAFTHINCLECGNCCRTTSPRITDRDVDRLAQHLQCRPAELMDKHMRLDEDGDYVFTHAPCPFLGDDNYCAVYAARPNACRDYPHTDRRKFYQALPVTYHNAMICPAVAYIVEQLTIQYR